MRKVLIVLITNLLFSCLLFGTEYRTVKIQVLDAISESEYNIKCKFIVLNSVDEDAQDDLGWSPHGGSLEEHNITITNLVNPDLSIGLYFNDSFEYGAISITSWRKPLDKLTMSKVIFGSSDHQHIVTDGWHAKLPISIKTSEMPITYIW